MSEILSRLLEVLARALAWVGLENLASDVLAGLFVEALKVSVPVVLLLITSLRSRLLRRHGERAFRRLRRRGRALLAGRRAASASDPEMERRYLSWLEGRNAEEDWDGPPLPVPAHLSRDRRRADRPSRRPDEEPVRRRRPRVRDLVRALDGFDTVLVLGDPGSGKSVALRGHARALARAGQTGSRPALLPVLADLGQWNAFAKEAGAATVPGFLAWSLRRQAEAPEAALYREPLLHLAAQLEELIFQGRTVLLFDSLDELPQDGRGEVLELLRRFVRDAAREGNRVILAGRTLDDAPASGTEILTLAPLERATIRTFLQTHAPTRAGLLLSWLEQDPALQEMAGNPLFLHALAELAGDQERPGAGMPSSRGEVLARTVDRRLKREATEKQQETLAAVPGGTGSLQSFLAQVGFAMQRRRDRGTSVDVREIPALAARSPGRTALLEIARRARLLEVREGHRETTLVRFTHLRYQELFAARELLRLAVERTDSTLELPLEDLRWEETVLLALDLAAEPREVLHLLTARRQREIEPERRDGGDGERLLRLTARALHRLEVRSGLEPADLELSLEVRRELEGLVNQGDPWGQARGIRALRELGPEESLSAIESALAASSPWVREEALTALLGMGVDRPRIRRGFLGVLVRAFGRSLLPLWPRRMDGLGELARLSPVLRKEPGGRGLAALAAVLTVVAALVALATTAGLGILVAAAGLIFFGLFYLFALPVAMGFLALFFALLPIVARLRPGTWKQSPARLAPALLDFAVWACAAFWLPWLLSLTLIFGHAFCIGAVWGVKRADTECDRTERETDEEQLGLLRGAALLTMSLALASQILLRDVFSPAQPEAALAFAGLGLLQLLWFRRSLRRWIKPWLRWSSVWGVAALLLSLLPVWGGYYFFKLASFDWLRLTVLFFAEALLLGCCFAFMSALSSFVPSLRAIAVLKASRRSSSSHRAALLAAVASEALPLWQRKRALRALASEVPASRGLLNRLGHLAATEPPAVLREALHRTIDQVESRLRQGGEEAGPAFQIRSNLTLPMPWVLLGAAGCLAATLAGAWRLLVPGHPDLALQMALSVPGLAVVCLLGVLATPGRASWLRAAVWITGLGLTAIVVTRPWQERLCAPSAMLVDFGGVFILDAASVYSAGWAVIAGLLGGALGFFLYELESGDAALRQELLSSREEDSRPVFPLLLLLLAAVVQSPPVAEYLPTASEPLPRFEQASAPGAVARLAGLAPGGRTVRVALVEAEDPMRLPLPLTFPGLEGDRPWSPWRRKTPHTWLERLLPKAGQLRGEVWLVTSEGTPRTWESLPGGCLAVAAAGPDWVELRLRDRCPASDPLGLVAIQYGPRWSREIAARAAPERVRAEIASRRSGRLLADTLSPSVRVVRSGPLKRSGR